MEVRALQESDAAWVSEYIRDQWAGPSVVSRGRVHDTRKLPGLVAMEAGRPVGLLLFAVEEREIEIVTLDAFEKRRGVGRALLAAVVKHALAKQATRVWLITTNDNVDAIAFYTRCGFRLAQVHQDAMTQSRRLKPEIPMDGHYGLPIRDELEFEQRLPHRV